MLDVDEGCMEHISDAELMSDLWSMKWVRRACWAREVGGMRGFRVRLHGVCWSLGLALSRLMGIDYHVQWAVGTF